MEGNNSLLNYHRLLIDDIQTLLSALQYERALNAELTEHLIVLNDAHDEALVEIDELVEMGTAFVLSVSKSPRQETSFHLPNPSWQTNPLGG